MLKDIDNLSTFLTGFDKFVDGLKQGVGNIMKHTINDIFNAQGPSTVNTSDLESRGENPRWKPLSPITIQLKGSSSILMNTRQMINFVKWQIQNSVFDGFPNVVTFGWHEDSGNIPYIAAIHEFGLTGVTQRTFDGKIMGGMPIGRTPEARAKVRWWFRKNLGMNVTGRVVIPERSMLRKTADIVSMKLENISLASLDLFLREVIANTIDLNLTSF